MIVTRKSIARRSFLRGAGAAIALPFLDAMVPALSRAETLTRTRRLGFWYIPNGAIMDRWTPAKVGADFEMTPILNALTPFRDKLTILTGLGHNNAYNFGDGNGDHSRATPTWLSGMRPKRTEGADVQAGTTADQIAAQEFSKQTQIASLELGVDANYLVGNCENGYSCVYMNTVSWRNPTTPNPVENNPRVIFERLFGDGGSAEQRLAQMRTDRSILDSAARRSPACATRWGRATALAWMNIPMRCARRNAASSEPKSRARRSRYRFPSGPRAFRRITKNT